MNMIVPGWNHVGIDTPVLLYGLAVTLLFTLATAMLPAYARGTDFAGLSSAAGRAGSAARHARLRAVLATSEIVLAFAVLCTAGLLLQSFLHLERSPIGFRESSTYAVQFDLPASRRYATNASIRQFYERAARALSAIPGVTNTGEALTAGLGSNTNTNYSLTRPIGTNRGIGQDTWVAFNSVSPGFFHTVSIALLAGRGFSDSDTSSAQPVAIVSKTFAVQHFGSVRAALNRRVSIGESSSGDFPMRAIIGVAGDVRLSLSAAPASEVYVPFAQVTFPGMLVVHTVRDDPRLATQTANAVARIDPLLPAPQVMSFARLRSLDDVTTRLATGVFLALAAIALLLALAGVYGVVAYSVERRTREFGIRASLGAGALAIASEVMREALLLGIAGIAIGTVVAALAARSLTQMLYQTSPLDPATFAGAAAFLLLAVLLATGVPVLRATKAQPAAALRYE
jgi:predicted permease